MLKQLCHCYLKKLWDFVGKSWFFVRGDIFLSELTPRQRLVLRFIEAFIRIKGVSPCLREVAEGLNMRSRSNIHRIVHKLQAMRYLRMVPLQSRTIMVLKNERVANEIRD